MSVPLTLAAITILAASAIANKKKNGSRSDKKDRACPKKFTSSENVFNGEIAYHGTGEEFDEFDPSESRTSYGMFFSPDIETARFYGKNVYKVRLFAKKAADLDDPLVLRTLAEEVSFSTKRWHIKNKWGEWREASSGEVAQRVAKMVDSSSRLSTDSRNKINSFLANYTPKLSEDELREEYRIEVLEEIIKYDDNFDEDHPLWSAVSKSELNSFLEDFTLISPDIIEIERAYGSQEFYMNHQDEILMAAERLGYDAVIFSDPSSTGESISYVVFKPGQVCIISTEN